MKKLLQSRKIALWSFFCLVFTVYCCNGDFLVGNDSKANLFLPLVLMKSAKLSFSPSEVPFFFNKSLPSSTDLPKYFIVPSQQHDEYVNVYGIGAGLATLPFLAYLKVIGYDLWDDYSLLWWAGKFVAALYTAGAALMTVLIALLFLPLSQSLLIGAIFAFATNAWAISSQALWQQTPNMFFIFLGLYGFFRRASGKKFLVLSGLALSMALLCRPTSLIIFLAILGYFIIYERISIRSFLIASLPLIVVQVIYKLHYFGSLVAMEQLTTPGGRVLFMSKNSGAIWPTPFFEGLFGTLLSPSRGVFIYSPVLLFSIWGIWRVCRSPQWRDFRPLVVALLLVIMLCAKWVNWWGGWSYGYRLALDMLPFCILCFIPIMLDLNLHRSMRVLFFLFFACSVVVQILGAYAYDLYGWNAPPMRVQTSAGVKIVYQDVDRVKYRKRLWSISDNQIFYYWNHFHAARAEKKALMRQWLSDKSL